MKNYTFNKDEFEFYMSDGSCVQAWQIESGKTWTLEIFPENQSKESFEACEFDGWLELADTTIGETFEGATPYSKTTYNRWNVNYPPEWTEELRQEFIQSLQAEINDLKLLEVVNG